MSNDNDTTDKSSRPKRHRKPDGTFAEGNREASKSGSTWDRSGLTRAELRHRADVARRLEEAGRGSRRWCLRRAGEAVTARRFIEACGRLRGAELIVQYDRMQDAHALLRRIEEECDGGSARRGRFIDPLA